MKEYKYTGNELDIFEQATNWKSYWSGLIQPHMGKCILEVGAGIGATSTLFCNSIYERWVSLEPDKVLCKKIWDKMQLGNISNVTDIKNCEITHLSKNELFDTILYIDVLEHIDNDINELQVASNHLHNGGKIIIISPAHNFLYSPFDKKIGHYRRYNKFLIKQITPPELEIIEFKYLDSVGLLASLFNKIILRSSEPKLSQIKFWDDYIIPISKVIDPMTFNFIGKSVMSIMVKDVQKSNLKQY